MSGISGVWTILDGELYGRVEGGLCMVLVPLFFGIVCDGFACLFGLKMLQ